MKKKDETKRKHNKFRIVALFAEVPEEDPIIFVARSKMKDLRKLFSYFKRECKYTKEFFEPGITAELFLLDDQWRSKASAYYHQIAWKRYFFEADFDVAGDLDTYENSLDLYGAAACIFQELSKIPLEEVMGRRYTHTSKTVEKEKEQKGPSMKKPGPLTERLSIRLSETEHRAFLDYCNKNDLTQREGLQMLLAGASGDGKYEQSLALEQNYRMKKIEEEIAKLRKTPRSIPEHQKLKEAFRFARQGVLQYIKMAAEQLPNTDKPMECIPWHEMKHTIPHYKKYAYPEQDAFFVFRVQTMCYGHGDYSAIFFWGINCETGEQVRLRYYPKRFYSGVNPHNSGFFVEGMYFLVGCRRIFPDVTELVAAFPLPWLYLEDQKNRADEEPADGVEVLIADAQRRSQSEY